MRLMLLLLLYPIVVVPQCAPGDIDGSCAQIKLEQYQLRGVRVKPYWTHVVHGGRDIRRRQSSSAGKVQEETTSEFSLQQPKMYAAQRIPKHLAATQQSFQVSGAVHQQQTNVKRRAHGVKSLILNKDPIDSFERALGGDEFDDRPPIEPIKVVKIESAEIIEPTIPPRKIGSNPRKTEKIIQSLTRHMNELRKPKVIAFSKKDEIINGEIVSSNDVKVTKAGSKRTSREMSDAETTSVEIANGILESMLGKNDFAKNASDLLRVLVEPELTTSGPDQTDLPNSEAEADIDGFADNNTLDSSILSFTNIDKQINAIGSEIDDYSVDEEWEEFTNTAVSSPPPSSGQRSMRRPLSRATPSSTEILTGAATVVLNPISTNSSQSQKMTSGLETNLNNNNNEVNQKRGRITTTATDAARTAKTPFANTESSENDDSKESTEESSEEEETAITKVTSKATVETSTRFDDGFRAAVKEQQAEILRARIGGRSKDGQNNKKKAGRANENIDEEVNKTKKKMRKKEKNKENEEGEEPTDANVQLTTEEPDEATGNMKTKYPVKTSRREKDMEEKKEEEEEAEWEEKSKEINEKEKKDEGEVDEKEEVDDDEEVKTENTEHDQEISEAGRKNGKKGNRKGMKANVDREDEEKREENGNENGEEGDNKPEIKTGGETSNIRTDMIMASLKNAPNAKYYYPPKVMVPLPSCFYNPSGYVCCNLQLNNLIEDTFEEIKNVQGHSACNIAKVANIIQRKSEEMFGHPFESIVALSDFAQNVHFAGDLVCKVEIDGKYMLTYATPYDADHAVEPISVGETFQSEPTEKGGEKENISKKKGKNPNSSKKKPLPIHNFRM